MIFENKIIYEQIMFLNCKKSFRNSYFTIPFSARIELSPIFIKYDATYFRTYDLIKIKVETFSFDLRPLLTFITMRLVFSKSKPYMKFSQELPQKMGKWH